MKLVRNSFRKDGVFGELLDDSGNVVAVTAEHAYLQDDGTVASKIPEGTYTCQRGQHQLHGMAAPFTTFQIMDVPNHTNILLHMGNWPQIDSDGCCLLGEALAASPKGQMVTNSISAFNKFIELQNGAAQFLLVVTNDSYKAAY
jgi:hypothetical protein